MPENRTSSSAKKASVKQKHWIKALFKPKNGTSIRSELSELLGEKQQATDDIGFSPEEKTLLKNILKIHSVKVVDVMIPRADIDAVDEDITLGALLKIYKDAGHSRLPVYRDTLDAPVGMVHIRDFMGFLISNATVRKRSYKKDEDAPETFDFSKVDLAKTLSHARLVRPLLFVPPSMPALDLLVKMQSSRMHMALVVDEYGGTDGLVSLEDLIETVVGDIEDEHDTEGEYSIISTVKGFIADARVPIEDVEQVLNVRFDSENFSEIREEVDTLGGFLVTLAGRVPARGELINGPQGLVFEVTDADARRLKRLRIRVKADDNKPKAS